MTISINSTAFIEEAVTNLTKLFELYTLRFAWSIQTGLSDTVDGFWYQCDEVRSGVGTYAGAARRRVHLATVLPRPPSGHRPGRRQARHTRFLQIGLYLTQPSASSIILNPSMTAAIFLMSYNSFTIICVQSLAVSQCIFFTDYFVKASVLISLMALFQAGHSVTVYERNNRIGGLLRYGIPTMKLGKDVSCAA